MPGRLQSVCGLDIRKDCICLAQYAPEAQAVTRIGIQSLEEEPVDWWKSLASELKSLSGEVSLAGENVVCSLPAEWAMVKNISVDRDENNIDETIRWEMEQQILGSMEEYALDYQKMKERYDSPFDHYLVVAYRKDSVRRLAEVVRSSKMNPIVVDLDIFGLINLFEQNYHEQVTAPSVVVYGENDQTTLVLTRDAEFLDYEVVRETFDSGSPERCLGAVNKGVQALSTAHQDVFQNGGPSFYLAGTNFSFPEVSDYVVQNRTNTDVLYPFKNISFQVGNVEETDLKRYAPRLAVAVGLAVRGGAELEQ